MVVCLQRSHRRGSIFDSAEFANSIRWFGETSEGVVTAVLRGSGQALLEALLAAKAPGRVPGRSSRRPSPASGLG